MTDFSYKGGRKSKFADRGDDAEKAVKDMGSDWTAESTHREFNRLVDSKAAGRVIKAAAADFEYFSTDGHGLIEVKETQHNYRLERKRITQLARLRKREKAGGRCLVLVFHSNTERWRGLTVPMMADSLENGAKGSWDLSTHPDFATAREALSYYLEAF